MKTLASVRTGGPEGNSPRIGSGVSSALGRRDGTGASLQTQDGLTGRAAAEESVAATHSTRFRDFWLRIFFEDLT